MSKTPTGLIRLLLSAAALGARTGATHINEDNSWYYNNWCGKGDLEYLQDGLCAKIFPNVVDRDWSCGVLPIDTPPSKEDGYQPDTLLGDVAVDTEILGGLITDTDVNLCLILTKRVKGASSAAGETLYNRYLCAGNRSSLVPYETWSSSKVFAMANAAGRLRSNETQCGNGDLQNHAFGVDGSVTGKHGFTILGDLATVICSYDQTAGYTSNSLASYFHDFGWRQRLYDNVQNWLLISSNGQGVKSSAVQSLGGNYGEATPSDLSFEVTAAAATAGPAGTKPDHDTQKGALRGPTQEDSEPTCAADKDPRLVTYTNTLSALSAAELVRRIALHREVPAELQFPNATWRDIQTILYGAEQSLLFPGQVWGGMTADTAIFTQAGLDLPSLLQQWDTQGNSQWRIFSKLGDGIELNHGEIVSNAYACIPRYDTAVGAGQQAVGGVEFTIAARASVLGDNTLKLSEQQLHAAVDIAVQYALSTAV